MPKGKLEGSLVYWFNICYHLEGVDWGGFTTWVCGSDEFVLHSTYGIIRILVEIEDRCIVYDWS